MIADAGRRHCTNMAALPHLDEEKHNRRGVKGTIVEGDDGGAMSREQVAHLPDTDTQFSHTNS